MANADEDLGETYSMLMEVLTGTATIETTGAVTQEAKNSSTSRSNCTSLGHIPRGQHILLQRCLVNHVPCFFFIIPRNLNGLDVYQPMKGYENADIYTIYPIVKEREL